MRIHFMVNPKRRMMSSSSCCCLETLLDLTIKKKKINSLCSAMVTLQPLCSVKGLTIVELHPLIAFWTAHQRDSECNAKLDL